jgi:hypothetical protein
MLYTTIRAAVNDSQTKNLGAVFYSPRQLPLIKIKCGVLVERKKEGSCKLE